MNVSRVVTALCAVVLLVVSSATPTEAMRHLRLQRASPAADTTLAAPPSAISLWFSEPTNPAISRIDLQIAGGGRVRLGTLARGSDDADPLTAALPPVLAPASYTVTWKTMSQDGHVVDGSYTFTIRAAD